MQAFAASSPPPAAAPPPQLLAVTVNDRPVDDAVPVVTMDGNFWLPRATLESARIVVPPGIETKMFRGTAYVSLAAVPGVTARLDAPSQTLQLTAKTDAMSRQVVDASPQRGAPVVTTGAGGFLNYDLLAQGGATTYAAGTFDSGISYGPGVLLNSAVARQQDNGNGIFTRLESSWIQDLPAQLLRLKLGDAVSRGGAWGEPVHFGGAQIATNFKIEPGFVSYPLPNFASQANLPSTVDVLVNNSLRLRTNVDSGPFAINQIPVVTGGGQATVVVTDLLGRQQVVNLPFYVAPSLLRRGLLDFSDEAGALRTDLGTQSNHYGKLILSDTHRYGVTDDVTIEEHAQLIGSGKAVGGSVATDVLNLGVLQGDAAVSAHHEINGGLAGIGFSRTMPNWSFGLNYHWLSQDFAQTLAVVGNTFGVQRSEAVANLGVSLHQWGSLSASLAYQTFIAAPAATVTSLTWTKPVTQRIFVSAYVDEARQAVANTTIGLALNVLFDDANSLSTQGSITNRQPQLTATARHDDGPDHGWDYGITTTQGGSGSINQTYGNATYHSSHGDFGAAIDEFNNQPDGRVTADGGFAVADGAVFAARRLDDSFAVVDVPGYPGVTITQENRPLGKTDADGRILVPNLISYYPNKIALDPNDVPITAELDTDEQIVTPGYRSPVVVTFNPSSSGPRSMTVRRASGEPIAPGVAVTRVGDDTVYRSGFDGEVFAAVAASEKTSFLVADTAGRCEFTVAANATADALRALVCARVP